MLPLKGVPVSEVTGIPGWETPEEEKHLMYYAGMVPEGGHIVEIGSEYGRSAGAFLMASHPSVRVTSVDLFPKDHHLVGNLLAVYQANLEEAHVDTSRVHIYAKESTRAAQAWNPDVAIDLLFIDGDHTYEGVIRDINAWTPFVRRGGYILYHDVANGPASHPLHYEVERAVEEFMNPDIFNMLTQVHSLRVYQRVDYD